MDFRVIQGDIAAQSADVLVNAANTSLRMGSGVAGALKRAAGSGLPKEAVAKGPVDLGAVAATDAYDLDAEWVIHAAAMPAGGQATAESIREATRNTLQTADELDAESLVMPALGCGIAGFDLDDGGRIIAEEIAGFDPVSLRDVALIAYSDEDYEVLQRVAASVE
ncbi:macro domain-containing protein [Halapricum salinum]|uniref:Appr-1-p processing protein n=1 Tax=Halapricum salinum TaxID=1457250 RepID=A0A4D6H929_9EURY|nr:macro domain-containing protein [Halapricum salinum]QCC50584.1 Appr-1-p processing protein [Halapricum salinum]